MKIDIELTRKDYLEFNKRFILKKRFRNSILIAASFIILWLLIRNFDTLNIIKIGVELLIFAAIWIVAIIITHKIQIEKIKKLPSKDGSILGIRTIIIEQDGLREVAPSNESFVKWDGIKKMVDMEDYIYIFVDNIAAYVIPTRYFNNHNEKELFIMKLKEKIE